MSKKVNIVEERISAEEYIDFFKKRTWVRNIRKSDSMIELQNWSNLFLSAWSHGMNTERL